MYGSRAAQVKRVELASSSPAVRPAAFPQRRLAIAITSPTVATLKIAPGSRAASVDRPNKEKKMNWMINGNGGASWNDNLVHPGGWSNHWSGVVCRSVFR